jgi:RNA polymerase sigma-70 factor (ECF subfamily)
MSWLSRTPTPPSGSRFEAITRPHLDRLYRLAYRFTGSRHDAEDLVQALLIKLITQEERLAAVDLPGPWMARALYHLYVDHARRHSRTEAAIGQPITDPEFMDGLADEAAESPEHAAERQLLRRRLSTALAGLPTEQRALLAWHDMEGYTLEELATSLNVPIGTLKSRLHRGRAALRRQLMEPSIGPERVCAVRTPA